MGTTATTATWAFARRNTNKMVQQVGTKPIQGERDDVERLLSESVWMLRSGHGSSLAGTALASQKHDPIGPVSPQIIRGLVARIRGGGVPEEQHLEHKTRRRGSNHRFRRGRKRRPRAEP